NSVGPIVFFQKGSEKYQLWVRKGNASAAPTVFVGNRLGSLPLTDAILDGAPNASIASTGKELLHKVVDRAKVLNLSPAQLNEMKGWENSLSAVAAQCNGLAGAACFGAGTKLLAPDGPKAIEEFKIGDRITSRSEVDPDGPLEVKVVEQIFIRTGRILHLHVN